MLKVFYSRQLDDFVVNEMCQCGHFKSEHGSLVKKIRQTLLRQPSEGNCCSSHCDCDCKQFTFARYVTADEISDIIINQRTATVE